MASHRSRMWFHVYLTHNEPTDSGTSQFQRLVRNAGHIVQPELDENGYPCLTVGILDEHPEVELTRLIRSAATSGYVTSL